MKGRAHLSIARSPRRIRVADGILVLPPVALQDLPPGGVLGAFMGIGALRFSTPVGLVAVFLHDLTSGDVNCILDAQRQEAQAQLGENYARRSLWGERP